MAKKEAEKPQPVSTMQVSGMQRDFMGPMGVDHTVRQAIMHCWMFLPEDQRTPENVEAHLMRLVKRAIEDMKEDAAAFGFTPPRSSE